MADSLGRPGDGEDLVRKTDSNVVEAGNRLSRYRNLWISVFTYFPGEPALLTDDSFCEDVMRQMGLARPSSQTNQKAPEGYKPVGAESVDLLDGDVIFGLGFDDNGGAMDDFEGSELFKRLEAEKADATSGSARTTPWPCTSPRSSPCRWSSVSSKRSSAR